jgi:hypothetical protein
VFAAAWLAGCGTSTEPEAASNQHRSQPAVTAQPVQLSTDGVGLAPTVTAKGMAVNLEGRFQSAVIARRNADGSISTECHDDQAAADAFVQGGPATRIQLEVQ